MEAKDQTNPLNEFLTEQEVLDLLGLKKTQLTDLRLNRGLPFCKISTTIRLYLVCDIVDYVRSKRIRVNPDENRANTDEKDPYIDE